MKKIGRIVTMIGILSLLVAAAGWAQPGMGAGGGQGRGGAELGQSVTPDQNQIQTKQQEGNALRDQLQAKRRAFRLQNQQLCPQAGQGMGRGAGRGMAMGQGGGQGRGQGRGRNW